MCLSRQGQAVMLPALWGLPPARLAESKCLGFGDDCCEYEIRWYRPRSWLPMVLSAAAGLGVGWGLRMLDVSPLPLELMLAVPAALVGSLWDMRRTHHLNMRQAQGVHEALEEVVRDNAQARRELLALNTRQAEWSKLLEEQVADRTAAMRQVVEHIRELREQRVVTLRGYSHDLRNPLTTIKLGLDWMRAQGVKQHLDLGSLEDAEESLERVTTLLDQMLSVASSDVALMTLVPQRLPILPLLEQLRRRLRALVLGRNIRVSTVSTREAPEAIETDLLLFDRVVDNLLTNAAKYTDSGSIVIQLDGRPGFLVLQVSDTGRGIDPDRIEQIFRGQAAPDPSGPRSFGVGLSVVVNLLAQVDGALEVMSLPGKGTTFWALIPSSLPNRSSQKQGESADDRVRRVVKIRKQVAS